MVALHYFHAPPPGFADAIDCRNEKQNSDSEPQDLSSRCVPLSDAGEAGPHQPTVKHLERKPYKDAHNPSNEPHEIPQIKSPIVNSRLRRQTQLRLRKPASNGSRRIELLSIEDFLDGKHLQAGIQGLPDLYISRFRHFGSEIPFLALTQRFQDDHPAHHSPIVFDNAKQRVPECVQCTRECVPATLYQTASRVS